MRPRWISLDLLRLLAVALVLASHLRMIPSEDAWTWQGWHVICNGSLGVSLFFVLSGFLVSGLLFSEFRQHGGISVRRFYVRRMLKIYPPLYLMLAVTYLYVRYGVGWKIPDKVIFAEAFFLQNYFPGYWSHTWSLAVEEHFYIALPLVLVALAKANRLATNPFRAVPLIAALVMVTVLANRLINHTLNTDYAERTHAFLTHLRIDALFFGMMLAYVFHFHSFERLRPWRCGLIIGGAVVALVHRALGYTILTFYYNTFGFVQEYLGSGAILVGLMLCDVPRNGLTTFLARLGSCSYSIYLWHLATIYWLTPHMRTSWGVKAAVYLIGALVIGTAMARLWELPFLKVRDKYFPSLLRKAA